MLRPSYLGAWQVGTDWDNRCGRIMLFKLIVHPLRSCRMTNDGDFITRLLKTIPETLPFTLHRPVGRLAYLFGVALVQAALDKMGRAPLLAPPEAGDAELEPPPLETVTRAVQFGGALRDDSIVPRSLTSKVHPAVLAVFNSGVVEPAARAMNWGHVLTRCAQVRRMWPVIGGFKPLRKHYCFFELHPCRSRKHTPHVQL